MSDIQQLNEDLLYEYHMALPIYEMARLTGGIDVHNDDDQSADADKLKFAHFHYKGVHFKLSKQPPKNATQARKLIAFKREQSMIEDKDLTELCRILKSKPVKPKNTPFKTVYDQIIDVWETLNDRDVDYID